LDVIHAVTIDAHGVLLLPDPDAIREILGNFDCQPDDATCGRAHYEMVRLLDDIPHPDWPMMNRSFAGALGVAPGARDEAGALLANTVYLGTSWIPAPGASSALARLRAYGIGAAVISNTSHGELAELLSRLELCDVAGDLVPVAAIIDSHLIGIEKPDPRPFLLALDALGESPTNCVHVGDSLHSDIT
jgi:putative hydrolase of the HAD superfamily